MAKTPLRDIATLPEGSLVRIDGITGRKGKPLSAKPDAPFRILDESGEVIAAFPRHARVELLERPKT